MLCLSINKKVRLRSSVSRLCRGGSSLFEHRPLGGVVGYLGVNVFVANQQIQRTGALSMRSFGVANASRRYATLLLTVR